MNKLNFKWILGLLYLLLISIFFIFQGEKNLVICLTFYLIAPITAVIAGIITLRRVGWSGKRATVLKHLLAALTLWLLGEIVALYLTWLGLSQYPSMADVFFLTGYALFSAAVILEAKLFEFSIKKINPRLLAVLSLIFILIAGIVVYVEFVGYSAEESLLVNLTTLSWSVGDLIMGGLGLILLALAWEYRGGVVRREWLWFMGATMVNLVADIIFNLSPQDISNGSLMTAFLNSMWVGAYFLFAGYFLELNDQLKKMQSNLIKHES